MIRVASLCLLAMGVYRAKLWLAKGVMQNPEWQMLDALDRLLHGMFVTMALWLLVSLFMKWLSGVLIWQLAVAG